MLHQRLTSAFLGIILLFTVLLSEKIVLVAAIFIVTLLIILELYKAFNLLKKKELVALGALPTIFVFIDIWIDSIAILVFLYILTAFLVLIFRHNKISFFDLSVALCITFFVTFFMRHVALVRMQENGRVLIWAVFIGAWITDTFAYFTGTWFGKHKLLPEISPKKTVEGAIGGVLGCVFAFFVYGLIISNIFHHEISFPSLMTLGFFCSLVAQLGDLAASSIKRECQIKDFGSIMPGHGGVLDRFDSILFVAPLVYYYINIFTIIK